MLLLEDLRFFIGLFFIIIGGLLLIQGLMSPAIVSGWNVNILAGGSYVFFGLASLATAISKRRKG